ncbi:hypothetical protein RB195_020610 [Necator americanus]|uniref:Uncharacterized protein n=1 Tax=Necator americanus TaxID=51031 RepID=A0ABR1CJM4_NECAM
MDYWVKDDGRQLHHCVLLMTSYYNTCTASGTMLIESTKHVDARSSLNLQKTMSCGTDAHAPSGQRNDISECTVTFIWSELTMSDPTPLARRAWERTEHRMVRNRTPARAHLFTPPYSALTLLTASRARRRNLKNV